MRHGRLKQAIDAAQAQVDGTAVQWMPAHAWYRQRGAIRPNTLVNKLAGLRDKLGMSLQQGFQLPACKP